MKNHTSKIFAFLVQFLVLYSANAQIFSTRTGFAGFYSKTPFEDIKAENNQVFAVMDLDKKSVAFAMLMKGFLFRKELMQEHFNENYVESDKYPKATFSGSFPEEIDPSKNADYTIHLTGTLTLHGVSKPFSTTASLEMKDNVLTGVSKFQLLPGDFDITIPGLVKDKIAKQIDVVIKAVLKPSN